MKETEICTGGLYIVSDSYFSDMGATKLVDNKRESRPNFFAMRDKDGIFWMIPLSTQTLNYKNKLAVWQQKHPGKDCVFYDFAEVMGKERVFLIGNAFPITAEYVLRPYTINGTAYFVRYTQAIHRIRSKLYKYLSLVESGKIRPNEDILGIKHRLLAAESFGCPTWTP